MFTLLLYKDQQIDIKNEKIDLSEWIGKEDCLLWLDLQDPNEEEIALLDEDFHFHELSIEDCIFAQSRPKVDEFENYLFLVIHSIVERERKGKTSESELEVVELNIFLGRNFVVTVHEKPIKSLNLVRERCKQKQSIMARGSDFLFYSILDGIVDSYFPILEKVDDEISKLEEKVLKGANPEAMSELVSLKKDVLSMRRIVTPQRIVTGLLTRRELLCIKEDTLIYLRDIYDHLARIEDILESHRDSLTSALDISLSGISNKLSETMKVLTIIATFMMSLTVITSYYGMNVELPETKWGIWGVVFVWVLLILAIVGMVLFFKKKKWF
jgi:magnesium transporter